MTDTNLGDGIEVRLYLLIKNDRELCKLALLSSDTSLVPIARAGATKYRAALRSVLTTEQLTQVASLLHQMRTDNGA